MNRDRLFLASCLALIVTAMSFAIRGDILQDFETQFGLDKVMAGWIGGAAFWGFGLSILFGGPLCDALGMKLIMRLAALGHILGTLLTIFAWDFYSLFAATLLIGIANGFVEAAINPLIATLYPKQKTHKLVILHAWFPGGVVIGGVLCWLLSQLGTSEHLWQWKMALMLPLAVVYVFLYLGQDFPATERVTAGVSFGAMFREAFRPLFIIIWLCMWLTAATELGTGTWITNIYNEVMVSTARTGILLLVWINGTMFLFRQFGGHISHHMSPIGLIAVSSVLAAVGLYIISFADSAIVWFIGTTVLAAGIAFWWPTMLGITSERFPRGGAFLLAVIGATGSFSTAVAGPVLGWMNKAYGPEEALRLWSIVPVALIFVFGAIYFYDRARGGYKAEEIGES